MIAIYSGAATLLAGAVAFSLFRFRTSDTTIESFIRETRPLSPDGKAALNRICLGKKPTPEEDVQLSMGDRYAIFRNSRRYVCVANRARLCVAEDTDLPEILVIMQEDHAKVRWQILLTVIESIVGKLGHGRTTHYVRELLWTYGDELELLDRISQKCQPMEGSAIRAIL